MLVTKAALREDEWVLIWGIGGGVALAAFELCRALGARTIVTSSSPEKLERARGPGRRRCRQPRGRRRRRGREGVDRWRRRRRRGRNGRRGDLGTLARRRSTRGPHRRVRSNHRAQPARAPLPAVVEAAHGLRVDDGNARGLRGRLRAHQGRASAESTSTACSRSPTPPRRTSVSSQARSSERSS